MRLRKEFPMSGSDTPAPALNLPAGPVPTDYRNRPIDLAFCQGGDDSGFDRLPAGSDAFPDNPSAELVEVIGAVGLQVCPVYSLRDNTFVWTDSCSGGGSPRASNTIFVRRIVLERLRMMLGYLNQAEPGIGITLLVGFTPVEEDCAAFEASYLDQAKRLGMDPASNSLADIFAVGSAAASVNSPAMLLKNDVFTDLVTKNASRTDVIEIASNADGNPLAVAQQLVTFLANLGRISSGLTFDENITTSKGAGDAVHIIPNFEGGGTFFGSLYDMPTSFAAIDAFETMDLADWFAEVRSNARLETYLKLAGFDPTNDGSLTAAYNRAKEMRRVWFWSAVVAGGLPYAGASTFWTFGYEQGLRGPCAAAITGASEFNLTRTGANAQFKVWMANHLSQIWKR